MNEATGQVVQRIEYDEFGNVILDTNPGFQPFGFAGGIYENTAGIIRFGIRDFDPNTGRWTMVDPSRFHSGEVSLFLYCSNDPINLIDVKGLDFSIAQKLPWWLIPAVADGPLPIGDAIAIIGVTYTLIGLTTHQEIGQNSNPLASMSDAELKALAYAIATYVYFSRKNQNACDKGWANPQIPGQNKVNPNRDQGPGPETPLDAWMKIARTLLRLLRDRKIRLK